MTSEQLQEALTVDRYPRSSAYDPQWVVDNLMGPHPLWQVEALMQVMSLEPGMRVLDLGCGTALTSIFPACEYDVEVFAADLWVKPTENWDRIKAAGLEGRVHPIYVDARDLPFAADFFDAVVSIGSYHYFGTDARYLADLSPVVKAGGSIGIVAPGLQLDPGAPVPPDLAGHWVPDFATWLGAARRRTRRCCGRTAEATRSDPGGGPGQMRVGWVLPASVMPWRMSTRDSRTRPMTKKRPRATIAGR
jgi:SAM-dependent methyltransferase